MIAHGTEYVPLAMSQPWPYRTSTGWLVTWIINYKLSPGKKSASEMFQVANSEETRIDRMLWVSNC